MYWSNRDRFCSVIKASSTKWQEWLSSGKDFFKKLIPKLSIGIDPTTDFSISFDWKELKKNSDEILNLPETISKQKNINKAYYVNSDATLR